MLSALLKLLTGGLVEKFTAPLERAYRAKLEAQNDTERIAADLDIQRLESARQIAVIEAQDRWSATRIGRLLIVLPYGIWWASIFAVSMINPLFGVNFVIFAVPPAIDHMASILIPAIIIGDVARGGVSALRRK